MLIPNPRWGLLLGQQGCGQGAYREHPRVGSLTRVGCLSAQPGYALSRAKLCLQAGGGNPSPHPDNLHCLFSALVVLRTFYLQGLSRADSAAWYADIQASAGGRGNALKDQQLSRGDIPIIVDSCIAFITQYGESSVVASLPEHPPAHTGQRRGPGRRHCSRGTSPTGNSLGRIGPL